MAGAAYRAPPLTATLKLLTLDATNTFLHFSRPVHEQYVDVARRYGIVVDSADELQQHFVQAYRKQWKLRPNFGQQKTTNGISNKTHSQRWWMDVVRDTFLQGGYVKDLEKRETKATARTELSQLDALGAHLYQHFCMPHAWKLDADAVPVLQAIRAKRPTLKLGVVSNFDERLERILYAMGCRHLFDFILTSVDAGAAKPSAEIFQRALREAGTVDASEALHFGNDFERDYCGARNAGWNALLFAPNNAVTALEENKCDGRKVEFVEGFTDLTHYLDRNFLA